MKDKILYLILGFLIGAVITAGVFLILQKNNKPQMPGNFNPHEFNGERPERGDFKNMVKNGDIPEMPEGNPELNNGNTVN